MADLPMPHQWFPSALYKLCKKMPTHHHGKFVFCLKQVQWWGIWDMQNTLKHQREGYDITVTSCQRCIDTDLQCKREKYEGKKPRKQRMYPRLLCADLCEYYERRYTMSKEYYDSRQSAGLLCCTVLGNKTQTIGFKWRFYYYSLHLLKTRRAYFFPRTCKIFTTTPSVYTHNHSRDASLMETVRWHSCLHG